MTDAELIARLRKGWHTGIEAADRIKALIFEVSTIRKACSDLSKQHIAEWNRAEAAEAKLVKAVEALDMLVRDCEADYPPSHGAIKYFAIATLADIKGENHE